MTRAMQYALRAVQTMAAQDEFTELHEVAIESALTPPDDLRKVAEKLAKDSMGFFYDPPTKSACFDERPEVDWGALEAAVTGDILTALLAVQTAEREKAEGLRRALDDIASQHNGQIGNWAREALAAHEASKGGAV